MEKIKKRCKHCRHIFITKRNPQQSYCHQRCCQNARKLSWRHQKRRCDSDYQVNQRRVNQTWHKCHPDYWRRYRDKNPKYTERNREQSRLRQRKKRSRFCRSGGQSEALQMFAKSDAFAGKNRSKSVVESGIYRLIASHDPLFAKSDALMVKIAVFARDFEGLNGND
jgi:hypothetical protein